MKNVCTGQCVCAPSGLQWRFHHIFFCQLHIQEGKGSFLLLIANKGVEVVVCENTHRVKTSHEYGPNIQGFEISSNNSATSHHRYSLFFWPVDDNIIA